MYRVAIKPEKAVAAVEMLMLGYLLLCILMWAFQRHLLYQTQNDKNIPAMYGLVDFQDLRLTSKDGVHVQAWYHQARDGYPTIVFFPGRGSSLGE